MEEGSSCQQCVRSLLFLVRLSKTDSIRLQFFTTLRGWWRGITASWNTASIPEMLGRRCSLSRTRDSVRTRNSFSTGTVTFRDRQFTGPRPITAWIVRSRMVNMGCTTISTTVQWMTDMMLLSSNVIRNHILNAYHNCTI